MTKLQTNFELKLIIQKEEIATQISSSNFKLIAKKHQCGILAFLYKLWVALDWTFVIIQKTFNDISVQNFNHLNGQIESYVLLKFVN